MHIKNLEEKGEEVYQTVYKLFDALLGEYDFIKHIGWIEWVNLNENEIVNLKPFIELRNEVDDRKQII